MILHSIKVHYIIIWLLVPCICLATQASNPIRPYYSQLQMRVNDSLRALSPACCELISDYAAEDKQRMYTCMYSFLATASHRYSTPYPGVVHANIIPAIIKMRNIVNRIEDCTSITRSCCEIISSYCATPPAQKIPSELSCITTIRYQNNTCEFFGTDSGDIVAYDSKNNHHRIVLTKKTDRIITLKYSNAPYHILISYDEGGAICFFTLSNSEQEISCYKILYPTHFKSQGMGVHTSSSKALDIAPNGQLLAFTPPTQKNLYIYTIPEGILQKKSLYLTCQHL